MRSTRTLTFAGDMFQENHANVETANVGALFQWEKGGIDSRDLLTREKSVNFGENLTKMQENAVERDENLCLSG